MLPALLIAVLSTPDPDLAARFQLAAVPGVTFRLVEGAPLPPARALPSALLGDINWKSMPEAITALAASPEELAKARVLLATERGAPLLSAHPGEVLITMDTRGAVRRWPYFNYLLHAAASVAAGQTPPRFGDWSGSPLPGPRMRRVVALGLAALWLATLLAFKLARRRGRARPAAARDFFAGLAARAEGATPAARERSTWSHAGFARPLAGLLTVVTTMLLLIGPYFALQSLLATRVQPFPEADGLWRTTFDTLWIAWATFDFGTQVAFVKYFAEHRVSRPADALADVQFYLWFQMFSRATELTLLCAVAIGWLPFTRYAIYAPFVALYGSCFIPSMAGIGKLMCQALQRFDYQNLLDMAEWRVLAFVVPIPFVLAGRAWGAAHPIYGEAFGAALGLGVGELTKNLVMLLIGLGVLAHLGVPIRPLFLAQFGRATARRQLIYGGKLTLGQEPFRLASFLATSIIIRSLQDFPTWLGIRDLLSNRLTFLYFFAWGYYQSAIPAFSEALAAGKRKLAQYYVARYLQFGFLFSATVFSLLMAIGPTFIARALGPQWQPASRFLLLAAAGGLLLPPAWVSDSLQQGAGRPGLNTIVMLAEQGLRLGLLLTLVPRMQFAGIYAAELIALGLKALVAWSINHAKIVSLRVLPWTMLGAPATVGILNFLIWSQVARVAAPASWLGAVALFFISGAASFFVCFFLCGLCGGFDTAALSELTVAARMPALVAILTRALAWCARAGTRISPLGLRTLALADEANLEAAAIDASADAARDQPVPA